jgi:peptidyl-prolyl cis-trans isomerase A (cyclophilin A)
MEMKRILGGTLCLAVLIGLSMATASGQTQSQTPSGTTTTKKSTSTTHHAATHPAVHRSLLNPASLNQKAPDTYKVKFTTTKGDFVIEITRAWAPNGADRFYNLVKNGFFTDVEFFRVVPDFVVQFGINGDPKIAAAWSNANITDDPVTQSNLRGYITYAQTSAPNSRSTQVFINLNDRNSGLDSRGFAPFGKVVDGMDVVDKLYGGYGEQITQLQDQIAQQGNEFLKKSFPELDSIKTAVIVSPAPAANTATPAKKPASTGAKKPAASTQKPAASTSQ